jgi:hypothetical protein
VHLRDAIAAIPGPRSTDKRHTSAIEWDRLSGWAYERHRLAGDLDSLSPAEAAPAA